MKNILKDDGHINQNPLDKTWSVRPELIQTRDTSDTSDTGDTSGPSGTAPILDSIANIKVSRETGETGLKLLGWPSAAAVGGLARPQSA